MLGTACFIVILHRQKFDHLVVHLQACESFHLPMHQSQYFCNAHCRMADRHCRLKKDYHLRS